MTNDTDYITIECVCRYSFVVTASLLRQHPSISKIVCPGPGAGKTCGISYDAVKISKAISRKEKLISPDQINLYSNQELQFARQ